MSRLQVVIVDDEPLARDGLAELLAGEQDVRIVAACGDGVQAVETIRTKRPDLVFLDVQMPGMDGFDVIAEIGAEQMPAVIFVTAYDEYAVKAFEVQALDYLLKPLDAERFRTALDRARAAIRLGNPPALAARLLNLLEEIGAGKKYLERISIRSDGRITFVKTRDVDWISAEGDYVCVHASGTKQQIRGKIGVFEEQLDPAAFVRIHRSTIVNIDRIKELQPLFYGEYSLSLHNGTKLTVSRSYREKLLGLLDQRV